VQGQVDAPSDAYDLLEQATHLDISAIRLDAFSLEPGSVPRCSGIVAICWDCKRKELEPYYVIVRIVLVFC